MSVTLKNLACIDCNAPLADEVVGLDYFDSRAKCRELAQAHIDRGECPENPKGARAATTQDARAMTLDELKAAVDRYGVSIAKIRRRGTGFVVVEERYNRDKQDFVVCEGPFGNTPHEALILWYNNDRR